MSQSPRANGSLQFSTAPPTKHAPRIVLNATEGYGKTSCGAYAENPVIVMAAGETGYETLLSVGRVPLVPRAIAGEWDQMLDLLAGLAAEPKDRKCLVLDALGGFERLCHADVCAKQFDNNWGEHGFASFQKGYDLSVTEWIKLLALLDRINGQGLAILLLSHAKIATFKNPEGADFDRYVADCHAKTWSVTHKWADAVLFGNFFTRVEGGEVGAKPKKGKGTGRQTLRVLYAERRDAFDAKNRYGMPADIDVPDDPSQIWSTITSAMKGAADA